MQERTAELLKPDQAKIGPERYVLIVGRGAGFLDYYRRVFANLGFTSLTVPKYETAVSFLRLLVFDLVVVDEGGGTFESRYVLEQARDLDAPPPILVIARARDRSCRTEAMRLGATDYLRDPVRSPEIARLIDTHLHPARQEEARTGAGSCRKAKAQNSGFAGEDLTAWTHHAPKG